MVNIFSVLAILGLVAGIALSFVPGNEVPKGAKHAGFVGFVVFGLLAVFLSAYTIVPAGHRGVLLRFGAVQGELGEGAHLVTPFVQQVSLVEVRTQKEEADATGASLDLQNVQVRVAVNFHVDPSRVGDLFKNVGLFYRERIIDPALQETVKSVVARYTAEGLIRDRAQVKSELDDALSQRLRPYGLVLEGGGASLKNFEFSKAFNEAIESKQVAQQESEKAKYLLAQAKIEADTNVTRARGEAEAQSIRARALNAQGGGKVLAEKWIEKWNGELPKFSGGTGGTMINLGDLTDLKGK